MLQIYCPTSIMLSGTYIVELVYQELHLHRTNMFHSVCIIVFACYFQPLNNKIKFIYVTLRQILYEIQVALCDHITLQFLYFNSVS